MDQSPDRLVTTVYREETPFLFKETLLEQGSGELNEDAQAIGPDCCIVCDGATSLVNASVPLGNSGGKRAAEITAEVFSNHSSSLFERARMANDAIREDMSASGINFARRDQFWSTSFAAVRLENSKLHWCQTGDCMIILLYEDGTSSQLTPLPSQDAGVLSLWQQIGDSAAGSIHQVLQSEIAAVRKTTNRDFGSLNGEPEAVSFLSGGTEELAGVRDIVLLTDGLFPPESKPGSPFQPPGIPQIL